MKNDINPLISIVTVSYNAVSTIERTILSVINQTYSNIEYIIIDGGSTDGTVDIIKKYQDKVTFWVSEPDKGIYDAMNKGIKVAAGDWINFMNSGDSFYSMNVLSNIFTALRRGDVLYGDNVLAYKWGKIVLAPDIINKMQNYMTFGHQTAFTRGFLLKQYGFDTNYKISADYAFFYKLYMEKYSFEYIPVPISLFDALDGVSNNYPLITFKEDAIINGKQQRFYWPIINLGFTLLFYLKCCLKSLLPKSYVARETKKQICKNPLIKQIIIE